LSGIIAIKAQSASDNVMNSYAQTHQPLRQSALPDRGAVYTTNPLDAIALWGDRMKRWEIITLVIGAAIALLNSPANALEPHVGARIPTAPNEKIVVRNDAGVKNATHTFAFGETCYSDRYLKTWFIIKRIVGDQVLLELECLPTVFDSACPNGTETSRSLTEIRARLNTYARQTDTQFTKEMQDQAKTGKK
jgi:hypothetical protein